MSYEESRTIIRRSAEMRSDPIPRIWASFCMLSIGQGSGLYKVNMQRTFDLVIAERSVDVFRILVFCRQRLEAVINTTD